MRECPPEGSEGPDSREQFFCGQRDLTTGPITSAILALALPTIVADLARTTMSLVDAFWVAKLGKESIAAVGVAGHTMFLIFTVFIGLRAAAMAMVSRAVGAGDYDRANHIAAQSLLLTFVFSLAVGLLGFIMAPHFFELLGTEAEVVELGAGYLRVNMLGALPMLSLFVGSGILRGAGDAMTPLVIGLISAFINLVLDPVLIFTAGMGVNGAALASVIAHTVAFIIGITILTRGRLRVRLRIRDFRPDARAIWQAAAVGLPASVRMSLRALMGLFILWIITGFGTAVVAAQALCIRIHHVAFMPTFGLGAASAALVGQNLGAGKPDRAQRSALVTAGFAVLVMGSLAALFAAFPTEIVGVFTDQPEVVGAAHSLLRITAPGLVFAAIGIVLSNAVSGAGDTIPPMIFTIIGLWAVQVPLAKYLSTIPRLGVTGVWWANVIAGAALAVMTATYFFTGRWKRKKV
ncbi:MAG: MATE family efflux transporter [Planctomycetota bacterium]|jgi:putative MATE family efflux protein